VDVRWRLIKRYELATEGLPARGAVTADRLITNAPFLRGAWRAPLNGQQRRREIIEEIGGSIPFDLVVETGTYRAATTRLLAELFDCPIMSAEANHRFFLYSEATLRGSARVTVTYSDSRRFLRELARRERRDVTVFAYLDAHWDGDLPLAEELEVVAESWSRSVVMIDDFRVPDDDGYGYDDYGPGAVLSKELLPHDALRGWSLLYPSAPSGAETGHRRGCCVLCCPQLGTPRWRTLRMDGVL
jgi:hypothetical protein